MHFSQPQEQEMAKLPEKVTSSYDRLNSLAIYINIYTYMYLYTYSYLHIFILRDTYTHTETHRLRINTTSSDSSPEASSVLQGHYSVCRLGTTEAIYHRTTNLIMLFIIPLGGDLLSASPLTATRMALDPPSERLARGEGVAGAFPLAIPDARQIPGAWASVQQSREAPYLSPPGPCRRRPRLGHAGQCVLHDLDVGDGAVALQGTPRHTGIGTGCSDTRTPPTPLHMM